MGLLWVELRLHLRVQLRAYLRVYPRVNLGGYLTVVSLGFSSRFTCLWIYLRVYLVGLACWA